MVILNTRLGKTLPGLSQPTNIFKTFLYANYYYLLLPSGTVVGITTLYNYFTSTKDFLSRQCSPEVLPCSSLK